ncbi:hypothetical protein ALC57_14114 [Trachymyrmex cornetzi]|uniref:Uncharacterized protein n=1 Tax=Trachymyrmex cornetzi TaxID=471704 RepID=A0A151IZ69_9HYME|nr:hypothetical protein ALC57_14114 [Trachymyrmex cornetzi]
MQEIYIRWVLGIEYGTPEYLVREELQRDKLRIKAGRAWNFEKRMREGKGRRQEFFRERGRDAGEIRKWGQRKEEFIELEKVDKEKQREERWEKIRSSRFNRWYERVKEERISGYLKKSWAENRWKRMAKAAFRYSLSVLAALHIPFQYMS